MRAVAGEQRLPRHRLVVAPVNIRPVAGQLAHFEVAKQPHRHARLHMLIHRLLQRRAVGSHLRALEQHIGLHIRRQKIIQDDLTRPAAILLQQSLRAGQHFSHQLVERFIAETGIERCVLVCCCVRFVRHFAFSFSALIKPHCLPQQYKHPLFHLSCLPAARF